MDTKSDDHLLDIEATIEANKQEDDKNHKEATENTKQIIETLNQVLAEMKNNKNNVSKSSPAQKDTLTTSDPNTTVQTNRRDPPLKGGISENIGGMWALKHEISSPRFYELLIRTELKRDTALYLKNFYNHFKMSLNAVTRLKVDLLPDYLSIKRNSEFKEWFVPDRNHISYSLNLQV